MTPTFLDDKILNGPLFGLKLDPPYAHPRVKKMSLPLSGVVHKLVHQTNFMRT